MRSRIIIRLNITESTNSVALQAGEQGAAPGTVVVADAQTGGRGRLNRPWLSWPGTGLYFSIILRPKLAPENLPRVTLAAGLATSKGVEDACTIVPQIKWPNDLFLEGKKFGGILCETGSMQSIAAGVQPLVVVGIGLNLYTPPGGFPPELKDRATVLADFVDRKISADKLLHRCVAAVESEVVRLEKGDFPLILAEWQQRDACRDRVLTWVTPQGREVTGVSLGPGADGGLRIEDRQGRVHSVISGDVNLAAKPSQKL